MTRIVLAASAALTLLVCSGSTAAAQTRGLSITNYQLVSSQSAGQTKTNLTYRADLVNNGPAATNLSATATSLDPYSARLVPGQDTLQFASVPAYGQVTSGNTFTVQISSTGQFDPTVLAWSFLTSSAPVANAGPNQVARIGAQVGLNGSASTNPSGVGTLTYSWAFASLPPGSTTFMTHPYTALPGFLVDVAGNYVATLTVSNGVMSSSSNVTVSTSSASVPPVANAGPNQTLAVGSTAVLNGSASTSSSGKPLSYQWTLLSKPTGSAAALTGAATVSPSFVVDKLGSYKAQLVVNDGTASSPAAVTVTTQTTAPVANAGTNQAVQVGAVVQLNGSGSTDANGLSLTYQWSLLSLPAGSTAKLSSATAVKPTFTADLTGNYVAQLIVSNGVLSSNPATVTITTSAATVLAPTANPGSNQTVTVGSVVTLKGSGTDPQNLPLTYRWALLNKPGGSAAALSNTTVASPTFTADLSGSYVAQLTVNNGTVSSSPATVTISTTCSQPVANPGSNQSVAVGSTVTLTGSSSGDACNDALTYSWSFTTRPAGSAAVLTGAAGVSPTFVPDLAGVYVAQLIVNNGYSNSNPATVTVTAASSSGTPSAGLNVPASVAVAPAQTVNFPVTLGTPASAGGAFISLSSSDTSKATVQPSYILIPQGATLPSRTPTLTGVAAGAVTITASAGGYAPVSSQVQVGTTGPAGATMAFTPASLGITGATTQYLTLNLSSVTANAVTVALASSNPGAATVPVSAIIGANTLGVTVPVTGVAGGSTTITATASGYQSATAAVTVTVAAPVVLSIGLPASTSVTMGQTATLPVTLSGAAPAGGVTVNLASNDTTKATVSASVFIPGGATTPASAAQVHGIGAGQASIAATASGLTSGSGQVVVTQVSGTSSFAQSSFSVSAGSAVNLTLNLSSAAGASGAAVSLSSSNAGVASVPVSVNVAAGASSVSVPVTAVNAGSATITATTPNFGTASVTGSVTALAPPPPTPTAWISLPANVVVTPGQTAPFPVTLTAAAGAPAGGIFITLATSDSSRVTIAPQNVFIAQGLSVPSRAPQVTGVGAGAATITASATSMSPVTSVVQTGTAGAASFSPSSLSLSGTVTQNLTFTLPTPATASGLLVNLSSSNPGVAAVPQTISIGANLSSGSVPVTGVAAGSTTITAMVAGLPNTTAAVTVTAAGAISLPASTAVTAGQSATIAVTLPAPAPAAGVTVMLGSSDTTKVTITASVFISGGATSSATPVQVNGIAAGTINITASAMGYTSGSGQVQVTAGNTPNSFFSPGTLSVSAGGGGTLTLNLSSPAPVQAGLTVNLTTTDATVANVLSSVTINYGSTSINVPVTGVNQGTAVITATTPGFGSANAMINVTAASNPNLSVTWYGACWQYATLYGVPGNYQAIDFDLRTNTPVVLEGTLFFTANCDPSGGQDNMNDYGSTINGGGIQGFSHHPNVIPSSAMYWIGPRTADGTCAPGAPCSGCVNYNNATPMCGQLP